MQKRRFLPKVYKGLVFGFVCLAFACSQTKEGREQNNLEVSSPDGTLSVSVRVKDGIPFYNVRKGEVILLNDSRLGLKANGLISFDRGMVLKKMEEGTPTVSEKPSPGHQYLTVELLEASSQAKMKVVFKVSNQGLSFRYEIPAQDKVIEMPIIEELTEFSVADNYDVWWAPVRTAQKAKQVQNRKSKISDLSEAVQVPLLLGYRDSLFLHIQEEGPQVLAAMTLLNNGNNTLKSNLENTAPASTPTTFTLPFTSPWRTILVSRKPLPGKLPLENLVTLLR